MSGLACLLVVGADGRWAPGIGDPTCLGWFTVVAYALGAFTSFRAARASLRRTRHDADERVARGFWIAVTTMLVALGINKQLDLQSWLLERVRDDARAGGWYDERQRVQRVAIVVAIALGVLVALGLARVLRGVAARLGHAIAGVCVLATFVVVRAVSFHGVDLLLGGGSFGLDGLLELGGIALIARSASREAKLHRRPSAGRR